jgi:hypothetical protein
MQVGLVSPQHIFPPWPDYRYWYISTFYHIYVLTRKRKDMNVGREVFIGFSIANGPLPHPRMSSLEMGHGVDNGQHISPPYARQHL